MQADSLRGRGGGAARRTRQRSAGPSSSTRAALARAAMAAVEPLVELFLDLGITSPEAESLLRSLFVHKSREWLARQNAGTIPSDVRVALVTGVHRNFVSRLLAQPPRIAEARQRKGHRATRLLQAWYDDPRYLDSSGKPRDLPEKGPAPSFEALASAWLPGPTPGVVLHELQRAGVVQLLADQRVRVRTRSMRVPGRNKLNINDMGMRARQLLETLTHNLRDPQQPLFCESIPPVDIDEMRVPVVQEVINRRATAFLQSLQAELRSERRRTPTRRKGKTTRFSLTVFESRERAGR